MWGPRQPESGFSCAADALAHAKAALAFVAEADVGALPTVVQAGLLRDLERAESAHTAARANVLGVFAGQLGFEDDGHRGVRSWLMWQTRVSRGAAGGAVGWARRLPAHPLVAGALAGGQVSASWARHICDWADLLPAGRRDGADQVLLAAAAGGAQLADLSGLAEEMYRRCAGSGDPGPGDPGPGPGAPGPGSSPASTAGARAATASRATLTPAAARTAAVPVTAPARPARAVPAQATAAPAAPVPAPVKVMRTGSGIGCCSWTCISGGQAG